MILVDTSVWIDYFNGSDSLETDILDQALGNETIASAPSGNEVSGHWLYDTWMCRHFNLLKCKRSFTCLNAASS